MRKDANGEQIHFSVREQKLAGLPEVIPIEEAFGHVLRIEALRNNIYAAANESSLPGSETGQRYAAIALADDLGVALAGLERAAGLIMLEGPDLRPKQ
ncbi:MAG TPA: hypothetical protein VK502_04675 [Candidatus Saccharimonadales bacterium]|nr:hypothetical protein [Candidatus Saccharimonadales bacterium]